ncbi:MAG TPA: serine hydrolase [Rhizomicrobium sp.]|jgi:CubicO group peptidase (beta-lactamase class C family)|nr:serine hydrolase [Rhizomicrobium sp.]
MAPGYSCSTRFTRAGASIIAVLSCFALFSCAHDTPVVAEAPKPQVAAAPPVLWPTNGWQTATPEAQGIDSTILADALVQIRARRIPVHSLLIERHGKIVLDSYFYPFAANRTHNVYSVTKSVTSMLVGIAMANHRLADLNAPVYSLLPVQPSDDPRKAHITLAHLLSMTSGLDCRPQGSSSLLQQMLKSPHLAAYMLNRPSDAEPGTVFNYCGGNSEVVSAVLTRTTGASALDLARQELFAPLGITHVSWPTDGDGVSHGWGDLELEPRDMAKLGYLWLHNGRWEDSQVIPADYLAQALTRHISVQPGIDYGYGMWLYPGHTPVDFEANGTGGQRITVVPGFDMVEVTTGNGLDANEVAQLLAGAVKSNEALPSNPGSDARLASLVAEAAIGPVALPAQTGTDETIPVPRPNPRAVPRPNPRAVPHSAPGVIFEVSAPAIPRPKPGAVPNTETVSAVVAKAEPPNATAPEFPPKPAPAAPVALAATN